MGNNELENYIQNIKSDQKNKDDLVIYQGKR
jgi:hypothetical protein